MEQHHNLTCPVCGGQNFAAGFIRASRLTFLPADAGIITEFFKDEGRIPAYICLRCRYILMFARQEDLPQDEQ